MKSNDVLRLILKCVHRRLAVRKRQIPLIQIIRQARLGRPGNFMKAIAGKRKLAVIAELKRSSPSAPNLSPHLDLPAMAIRYRRAGAAALSVLTEEDHFAGSLADLRTVSARCALPVLRKDFIIDEYQIYESRAHGASAILLIVRALRHARLEKLHRLALKIGLAPLVEIHDENELDIALSVGARLIGVNNRNLSTLQTDLGVARRILPHIPKRCVSVAESGYSRVSELAELAGLADAVLIGTAFLKNPGRLRRLIGRFKRTVGR